jgi:hypothetical protein
MTRRIVFALPAVVLFVAISIALARFLAVEGAERQAIEDRLSQQAGGPVKIIRLDSETAYSVRPAEGWTRVVWAPDERSRPVVQCVRVRRGGNPLTGMTVTLLHLQAPLKDSEGSCR